LRKTVRKNLELHHRPLLTFQFQMPKQKAPRKQLKSYKLKHINKSIQGTSDLFILNLKFVDIESESFDVVLWLKRGRCCVDAVVGAWKTVVRSEGRGDRDGRAWIARESSCEVVLSP
jgi:hypothetical protein